MTVGINNAASGSAEIFTEHILAHIGLWITTVCVREVVSFNTISAFNESYHLQTQAYFGFPEALSVTDSCLNAAFSVSRLSCQINI